VCQSTEFHFLVDFSSLSVFQQKTIIREIVVFFRNNAKNFIFYDPIIYKYKKTFQQFSFGFAGFLETFRTPRGVDKTRFCIYGTDFGRFCRNAKNSKGKNVFVE